VHDLEREAVVATALVCGVQTGEDVARDRGGDVEREAARSTPSIHSMTSAGASFSEAAAMKSITATTFG
jgi:hypothetical protein